MNRWIISADRRRSNPEAVRAELLNLCEGGLGLEIEFLDDAQKNAPDAGKFRDFAPLATVTSEEERILAWLLEELVATFGWAVDLARTSS